MTRSRRALLSAFVLLAALPWAASGCPASEETPATIEDGAGDDADARVVTFTDGHVTLAVDREWGTFDVAIDGYTYVRRATSAVETGPGGLVDPSAEVHAANARVPGLRSVTSQETAAGTEVRIEHPASSIGRLTTVLTILRDRGGLTARLEVRGGILPDLLSLIPIYVGGPGGGLFLKSDPRDVQILQNGAEQGFDHYVDLIPGDTPYSRGFLKLYRTDKPSSASNWNALVYDRANAEGLNLGYLSFERVIPEVVIGFDVAKAPVVDGRRGFFAFQSRNAFLIARPQSEGGVEVSELFWMDRFTGRPQAALERYARLVAGRLGIRSVKPAMAGWDSWYYYGDKIDQRIIEENLRGLAERFVPYGLSSMEVDLGWQARWGDWDGDPARFPDGIAALAAKIRAAGLTPELWIAGFDAHRRSALLREHPEWQADYAPLFLLLMQPGTRPLDLTREDVVAFVRGAGAKVAAAGYDSTKFDFGYYQLAVTALQDPSMTVVEAYRRALAAYREGFGDDRFLINILLGGINYGLVDSFRIGVDTWPCWGDAGREHCPYSRATEGHSGMGLRIALKTLARRYYLNNVVWVNHPDQIFFRDFLGLTAQRSWGTVVALSGAMISLGDSVASLSPEAVDTFRRFLPPLGITGVPQDLFEREYPEVWLTPLTGKNPGGYVLGLYSWGNNWDLTRNPRVEILEGTRRHTIALADLGLSGSFHAFEFWTQADLGVVTDRIDVDVPARDSRVVVLRPVEAHPYLVASNRHVSQGGTDLHGPAWDDGGAMLSWGQDLVAGFGHTVYIDPADQTGAPAVGAPAGVTATIRRYGDLWAVDLSASASGRYDLSLSF